MKGKRFLYAGCNKRSDSTHDSEPPRDSCLGTRIFFEPCGSAKVLYEEIKTPQSVTMLTVENLDTVEENPTEVLSSLINAEEPIKATECCVRCPCKEIIEEQDTTTANEVIDQQKLESILKEKEEQLQQEFQKVLDDERNYLKDRFNFILQNEQVRAALMLQEAHRERKEKIDALQTQLECKNLAALMYVMCAERRKSRLEKLQIVEKYTEYIDRLHEILNEGQDLIIYLSRGYKTAARVNQEWQEKMKRFVAEFQNFIYNFFGGNDENNQYFFDVPKLLKCETPTEDDPREDPIESYEDPQEEAKDKSDLTWWEKLEEEEKPFVVYGDMGDFKAARRREVLKHFRPRAEKTAPRKWKEYVFRDMFIKSECPKANEVKDELLRRMYSPNKFMCENFESRDQGSQERRLTTTSVDVRGAMGSILKIITATGLSNAKKNRADLLGARDSLEIASTTKLRENHRRRTSERSSERKSTSTPDTDTILVGSRKTSFFDDARYIGEDGESKHERLRPGEVLSREDYKPIHEVISDIKKPDEESSGIMHKLPHTDSLQVLPQHQPDVDSKLHPERACPSETCTRMRTDSFMRALPPYMKASPFEFYEQSFENYQACSPEQLRALKQRIAEKKKLKREEVSVDIFSDWKEPTPGVFVQTSEASIMDPNIPPCTCRDPPPTPASSVGKIYNLDDLMSVKLKIDEIKKASMFNEFIEFQRFKVLGRESKTCVGQKKEDTTRNFSERRVDEIKKILKDHPSLCDIFQANTTP